MLNFFLNIFLPVMKRNEMKIMTLFSGRENTHKKKRKATLVLPKICGNVCKIMFESFWGIV